MREPKISMSPLSGAFEDAGQTVSVKLEQLGGTFS